MSPKLTKTPNSRHSPESWKEKEGKLLGPHSVLLCSNPITHFDFSFTEILLDLDINLIFHVNNTKRAVVALHFATISSILPDSKIVRTMSFTGPLIYRS